MEEWRSIKGYGGVYEVSNQGNVRSITRRYKAKDCPRGKLLEGKTMKTELTPNGYIQVILRGEGKSYSHRVHRLVAEAFIPNPDKKPHVNHINGMRTDNRVENLEWCTVSENLKHIYELGYITPKRKLTREQIEAIRKDDRPAHIIAKEYNSSATAIGNIKRGTTYKSW